MTTSRWLEVSSESRIIELETRQAFQDDTLQALNDVVVEQGRVIERLQLQMAELLKRYEEMVGQYGSEGEEAPPPHY
jgi:SlyX protein